MSGWRIFGEHQERRVDDTVELRLGPTISDQDVVEIYRIVNELQAQHRHVFLIIDAKHCEAVTPAARRCVAELVRTHPEMFAIAAVFGASATIRAIATLLNAAVRIFGGRPTRGHFAKTEEDARALVDQIRTGLRTGSRQEKWRPPTG